VEHVHDPVKELDGITKCRTCGQILTYAEETIAIVNSNKGASRILQEVAAAGHYQVSSISGGFAVYSKEMNGAKEEITARKLSDRNYVVLKRIYQD